jgi:DNA-binding IclR family transcriptional regulator
MGKLDEQIMEVLQKTGKPMTLVEIAEHVGKPTKSVFKALQKLFNDGKINSDVRTRSYTLSQK